MGYSERIGGIYDTDFATTSIEDKVFGGKNTRVERGTTTNGRIHRVLRAAWIIADEITYRALPKPTSPESQPTAQRTTPTRRQPARV